MTWCWLLGHKWFLMPERTIIGDPWVMCQRCLAHKTVPLTKR